jgi:hypothetical protein
MKLHIVTAGSNFVANLGKSLAAEDL